LEIIVQLRAERAALVDRVAHIDKILKRYDDLSREAEQLLSSDKLTSKPETSGASSAASMADDAEVQPKHTSSSMEDVAMKVPRVRNRNRTMLRQKTPIEQFEEAVIDVLRGSAVSMDRNALYDALTARGIVIGDGDKERELNALSARVYRMSQGADSPLVNRRGQGYRLRSEDDFSTADQGVDKTEEDFPNSDLI
jgi:hypothetical protein